jgi:hypothetical protein
LVVVEQGVIDVKQKNNFAVLGVGLITIHRNFPLALMDGVF